MATALAGLMALPVLAQDEAPAVGDLLQGINNFTPEEGDPEYKFKYWGSYWLNDLKETARIRRDCIWKIPPDLLICGLCPYGYEDDHGNLICDVDNSPVGWDDPCKRGYYPIEVTQ